MHPRALFLIGMTAAAALAAMFPAAATLRAQPAPQKELIAVLDLDIEGGSKVEASGLSDRLREALLKSGQFTLVDRGNVDKVLDELALQQTACTSQECAVQVGRILGVRKIIVGKVTKFSGELWQVASLMIDVETSETLRAESVVHEGGFVPLLRSGILDLAAKLAGAAAPATPEAPRVVSPAPPTPAQTAPSGHGVLKLTGLSAEHRIEVDGAAVRPAREGTVLLTPGLHIVTATRRGFIPREARITIEPEQTASLNVGLVPVVGYLTVSNSPKGARMTVTGGLVPTRQSFELPVSRAALPVGEYRAEILAPGQDPFQPKLSIRPNEETTLDIPQALYEDRLGSWRAKYGSAWILAGLAAGYGWSQAVAVQNFNDKKDSISLAQYREKRAQAKEAKNRSDTAFSVAVVLGGIGLWIYTQRPEPPEAEKTLSLTSLEFDGELLRVGFTWRW